jgi:hypothetical protein
MDDLTFLRGWSPQVAGSDMHIFPVPDAYRVREHDAVGSRAAGPNAPRGAVIHYYLKTKPAERITLEILNAENQQVAIFRSKEKKKEGKDQPAAAGDDEDEDDGNDPDGAEDSKKPRPTREAGVQRFVWDLRYKGAEKIRKAKIDTGDPESGPLAAPGTYTARLTVHGKSVDTKFEVVLDPRLADPKSSAARAQVVALKIRPQLDLALQARDNLTEVTRLVHQLRAVRKQLEDRQALLKEHAGAEELVRDSKAFLVLLEEMEAKLHNPKAEVTYDILAQKGGAKLYSQLGMLYEELKNGDNAPTQGLKERAAELAEEVEHCRNEQAGLWKSNLARLNEQARKLDVPTIYLPPLAPPARKD